MADSPDKRPASKTPVKAGKMRRLASIARVGIIVATILFLVGWGVFAVTTILPDPNNTTAVYGAFQSAAKNPSWPMEYFDVPVGAAVSLVVDIHYSPYPGCGYGYKSGTVRNGTVWVFCGMSRPNTTLTSSWTNYASFSIIRDPNCYCNSYWTWISGPTANLTDVYSAGGFFETSEEGNYTAHINDNLPVSPYCQQHACLSPTHVNGTMSFTLGHVQYTRPYFATGLVTFVVAALFTAQALLSQPSSGKKRAQTRPAGALPIPRGYTN